MLVLQAKAEHIRETISHCLVVMALLMIRHIVGFPTDRSKSISSPLDIDTRTGRPDARYSIVSHVSRFVSIPQR
jgi:hypothetical protein